MSLILQILKLTKGEKIMGDRFKTSEDAETRYEKLVSEIKRIHGELIFEQKLDGFDLKKIDSLP